MYLRVGVIRGGMHAASVAVLIVYALLTSFAPAELLLLANDDDLFSGPITREEAQEHFQAHLQRARDALAGVSASPSDHRPDTGSPKIASVPLETGVQSVFALATAVLPFGLIITGMLKTSGVRSVYPSTLDSSPQYGIPRLPPRRRA